MTRASVDADHGSGSILGVAILGAVLVLVGLVFPLQVVLVAKQRVSVAADSSALAGADVAVGLLPGNPCPAASLVADEHDATLIRCEVDGSTVTVRTMASVLGFEIFAQATAGQHEGDGE